MKLSATLRSGYERGGLWLLNLLARGRHYVQHTEAYGQGERQRVDIYRAGPSAGPRPTVMFFYGGNWRSGRRQDYRFVADTLVRAGFDVAIPDYRLFPLVSFDAIWADACAAFHRVRRDVSGPLYLMGHSAGAQLAALLALREARDDAAIDGFVGLAGPYDFYPFTEDDHWTLFAPDFADSQPVNFVRADAAPFYLLHGHDDTRVRRGHSKSLMEKQQALGARAFREVYENTGHVDIILSFSALHRGQSAVVSDVTRFIGNPLNCP